MHKITITFNNKVRAELNESKTIKLIYNKLHLRLKANLWGDEIYFSIPVQLNLDESLKEEVPIGTLAY